MLFKDGHFYINMEFGVYFILVVFICITWITTFTIWVAVPYHWFSFTRHVLNLWIWIGNLLGEIKRGGGQRTKNNTNCHKLHKWMCHIHTCHTSTLSLTPQTKRQGDFMPHVGKKNNSTPTISQIKKNITATTSAFTPSWHLKPWIEENNKQCLDNNK